MAEKRKPVYTMLLRKQGNTKAGKVEIYRASEFDSSYLFKRRYRVRVNGKWWPKGQVRFITPTQIKELVFRQIGSSI